MARIKVRLDISYVCSLETENYVDAWQKKCDEDREDGDESPYPPVPENFAIEQFEEDLNNGNEDLGLILQSAEVTVAQE